MEQVKAHEIVLEDAIEDHRDKDEAFEALSLRSEEHTSELQSP